jgi:hypothetical protein
VTGVNTGAANVTATLGAISNQSAITITGAVLQSINVTSSGSSLAKGLTLQYVATGIYSDASSSDLSSAVTWGTSNSSVATVSNTAGSKGLVTGVNTGAANVTATLGAISNQSAITITAPVLQSISVTSAGGTIAKGLTRQYTATGTYSDGSTADITSMANWSSSATGIATVSDTAGTKGLATAAGIGSTDIVAQLSSVTGQASIQVTAATLVSIAVTPANSTIVILVQTKQMIATGTYTDGTTANITASVTWSSTNTSTATISNNPGDEGKAWGLGLGATTIRATAPGGVFGTTQLNGIL